MKKSMLVATALIAISTTAQAEALRLNRTLFSSDEFNIQGRIELNLTNTSSKEIVAFKGTIVCNDAFGEEVIRMPVISRSANIPAGKTDSYIWAVGIWTREGKLIQTNNARNFKCSFVNQQIVN